jgi:hypothetical protein
MYNTYISARRKYHYFRREVLNFISLPFSTVEELSWYAHDHVRSNNLVNHDSWSNIWHRYPATYNTYDHNSAIHSTYSVIYVCNYICACSSASCLLLFATQAASSLQSSHAPYHREEVAALNKPTTSLQLTLREIVGIQTNDFNEMGKQASPPMYRLPSF